MFHLCCHLILCSDSDKGNNAQQKVIGCCSKKACFKMCHSIRSPFLFASCFKICHTWPHCRRCVPSHNLRNCVKLFKKCEEFFKKYNSSIHTCCVRTLLLKSTHVHVCSWSCTVGHTRSLTHCGKKCNDWIGKPYAQKVFSNKNKLHQELNCGHNHIIGDWGGLGRPEIKVLSDCFLAVWQQHQGASGSAPAHMFDLT